MKRLITSKSQFLKFLGKFRSGELKSLGEDGEEVPSGNRGDSDHENRERRRSFLRLYARRLWPHWKLVLVMILLSITVSVLEIVQPLFAKFIFDDVLLASREASWKLVQLNRIGAIFLGFVVVSVILGIARSWYQRLLNERVVLTLRRALFERLLHLPLDQLAEMKVGGIISRLTDDINRTSGLMQMAIVSPGVAVLRLLVAMVILFAINWKLALTALGIIPPITLLSLIAIRRIRPIYRAIRKDVSRIDGRVGEAFHGVRAVRAFRGERREQSEYNVGHNLVTRMKMFATSREIVVWSVWGLIIALNSVIVLWAGGYWYILGQATIGDIGAFQIYLLYLLNPVWQIVESMTELQRSLAAMERVFEVLETPPDKPDISGAVDCEGEIATIEFEDVSFAYNQDNGDVIRNFSLTVPGGSVVALVGRSGAGKTTLTDLVARFHDPVKGHILLNGIDLREYRLDSWREQLGIVQQEVFLFDGTVFDNIAYANREATREQVVSAARLANADQFIVDLPDGYESVIGERGVKLSGGQRQRLAIARALLADPQVLILDEATSNLDTESEQLIQRSLGELLKGRTTFVIAHRLSTITHADIIVVLDHGEMVETGTHGELLQRGGLYLEMIQRQRDSMGLSRN